jgi:hypothetical protein
LKTSSTPSLFNALISKYLVIFSSLIKLLICLIVTFLSDSLSFLFPIKNKIILSEQLSFISKIQLLNFSNDFISSIEKTKKAHKEALKKVFIKD